VHLKTDKMPLGTKEHSTNNKYLIYQSYHDQGF